MHTSCVIHQSRVTPDPCFVLLYMLCTTGVLLCTYMWPHTLDPFNVCTCVIVYLLTEHNMYIKATLLPLQMACNVIPVVFYMSL